jgi:hypothetical protein
MNTETVGKAQTHWYREPWPWILIGLPMSAVIAGIATLIIAIENQDGLVAEDYYKQGLAINRVLAREQHARDLGLTAQMMVSGKKIRIRLDGQGAFPESIRLRFIHPTRAGEDREADLNSIACCRRCRTGTGDCTSRMRSRHGG